MKLSASSIKDYSGSKMRGEEGRKRIVFLGLPGIPFFGGCRQTRVWLERLWEGKRKALDKETSERSGNTRMATLCVCMYVCVCGFETGRKEGGRRSGRQGDVVYVCVAEKQAGRPI